MLAGIVLLLVTGSVFFFSLVIFTVLAKAYEQYQERYVVKSMNDLSDMFLFIDARQLLVLNIASMCLLGILSYIIFTSSVNLQTLFKVLVMFFTSDIVALVRYIRVQREKK